VSKPPPFYVRFWGVRGSIPSPGRKTQKFGGNTPTVEIRCGERVIVFDAGTGLRALGENLALEGVREVDLFFSHTHLDHITGLPFCSLFFREDVRARVWAGNLLPGHRIESVLRSLMTTPLFPVPLDIFKAKMTYHDFQAGTTLTPARGVTIRTAALNHPGGCTGYRVEFRGKSICYVTDTEHRPGAPDQAVLELVSGADIVIYDATYLDEEFERYVGWGHSTWQEGVRVCRQARAKKLVLFHHAPDRTDAELDRMAVKLKRAQRGAVIAREGMRLSP